MYIVCIVMSNYIIFIRLCMHFRKFFLSLSFAIQYFMVISQTTVTANGTCLVNAGLQVLGKPYMANLLDQNDQERLISTSAYFDCVTLVEHLLASCLSENHPSSSWKMYDEYLQSIRYRKGNIDGYTSRLHYFSEWILQQQENGYIANITKNAGGVPLMKPIHFMTSNRRRYPKLKKQNDYNTIREIEKRLSKTTFYHVSSNNLLLAEKYIQAGDIIAITSARSGLDVEHVGMAVVQNGRIHLLHASSRLNKVVITKVNLVDFVSATTSYTGIIILRPTFL